jgi:predicted glutamine amidotransferase
MCQLLGISSNKKVDAKLSLSEFRHRGKRNPHGWGFGFYNEEKNNWVVIKEPKSLYDENIKSEKFNFKNKIIIGYVRLASCGSISHKNTHPFTKENYIFAHNGTVSAIKNHSDFKLKTIKPEGETDSEYAFCYILEKIKESPYKNIKEILQEEAEKIKKYGRFNFLFSDGVALYAYGDDSLYFCERKFPFGYVKLRDDQYEIDLGEIKAPDEKAIIIATEPLTENEEWIKIFGLKAFKDGEILF